MEAPQRVCGEFGDSWRLEEGRGPGRWVAGRRTGVAVALAQWTAFRVGYCVAV